MALECYKKAFGATELMRLNMPDGKIAHAELKIGDSMFMISDENPDWCLSSPQTLGGSPVTLYLYMPDVDEMVQKAVAAGGTIYNEPQDHGFMYAHGYQDLGGHIWELLYREPSAINPS
ncbi:MAG: VOC family protein [Methylococcaceae bacterium]|nr:VOC family protein [Methylococcaceae bacterium]MDD1644363.1 VOC family protein [Methylococcaceae bacterium]